MSDRISHLFQQAIGANQAERCQLLDSLTEDERNELEALLAADAKADAKGLFDDIHAHVVAITPTIQNYHIRDILGEGGMGNVYAADQLAPVKRQVAVKVIRTTVTSKEVLARFEAERQALALMDHPHIAKVFDAGVTLSGQPFIAMELVRGTPLTDYCDERKLPPSQRLALIVQACRAIQHAHQKGVVHRDIKPSNMLVTEVDGMPTVKVIDFGLAKAVDSQRQLNDRTLFTQAGQVVGTLAYMSPEQADMNAPDIDTRTDVYSLGVVLYETLAGSTPIERERISTDGFLKVLASIRNDDPPLPSSRLSQSESADSISANRSTDFRRLLGVFKGDLDWIAVKALEKDRSRRYQTPAALADDIEQFLRGDTVSARPPTLTYITAKAYRRHQRAFLAAAAMLLLLVAGLVGTGVMWRRAVTEAGKSQIAEADQREARSIAEMERDRAEATLARSNYFLAIARWDSDQPGAADALLDRIPSEYRQSEWYLAKRHVQGSDLTCSGHAAKATSVVFSKDGKTVFSASEDGTVKMWNAETGEELKSFLGHSFSISALSINADGTQLVTCGRNSVRVWDLQNGQQVNEITRVDEEFLSMDISPDATRIAVGESKGAVRVWNLESGEPEFVLEGHERNVQCVRFSPDGRYLASASDDRLINIWDMENGERRPFGLETSGHIGPILGLDFRPDGAFLATADREGLIRIWDFHTEACTKIFGHVGAIHDLRFSPDGLRFATAGADNTVRYWNAVDYKEIAAFVGHTGSVRDIAFNSGASRIASVANDGMVKIWDPSGNHVKTYFGHERDVRDISFAPGSRQLVTASRDGSLHLIHAETAKTERVFLGHDGPCYCVDFSPVGNVIASGGQDATLRLWDAESGTQTHCFVQCDKPVRSIAISPDGKTVAAGSDDSTIRVWDAATGKELKTMKGRRHRVTNLRYSPDGKTLISSDNSGQLCFWDIRRGVESATIPDLKLSTTCFACSRDGTWLVTGSKDTNVRIREFKTGKLTRTLHGHRHEVQSVLFTPDGKWVISADAMGSVKIWEVSSGDELRTFKLDDGAISSIAISQDGRWLASGGSDDSLRIMQLPIDTDYLKQPSLTEFHRYKAGPRGDWHRRQCKLASHYAIARNAETTRSIANFAIALHCACELVEFPDSVTAKAELSTAWQNLDPKTAELLPHFVREHALHKN